jgi:hypothetical protein
MNRSANDITFSTCGLPNSQVLSVDEYTATKNYNSYEVRRTRMLDTIRESGLDYHVDDIKKMNWRIKTYAEPIEDYMVTPESGETDFKEVLDLANGDYNDEYWPGYVDTINSQKWDIMQETRQSDSISCKPIFIFSKVTTGLRSQIGHYRPSVVGNEENVQIADRWYVEYTEYFSNRKKFNACLQAFKRFSNELHFMGKKYKQMLRAFFVVMHFRCGLHVFMQQSVSDLVRSCIQSYREADKPKIVDGKEIFKPRTLRVQIDSHTHTGAIKELYGQDLQLILCVMPGGCMYKDYRMYHYKLVSPEPQLVNCEGKDPIADPEGIGDYFRKFVPGAQTVDKVDNIVDEVKEKQVVDKLIKTADSVDKISTKANEFLDKFSKAASTTGAFCIKGVDYFMEYSPIISMFWQCHLLDYDWKKCYPTLYALGCTIIKKVKDLTIDWFLDKWKVIFNYFKPKTDLVETEGLTDQIKTMSVTIMDAMLEVFAAIIEFFTGTTGFWKSICAMAKKF